jgi:hypothetical protein
MNVGPSLLDGWRALVSRPAFKRGVRLGAALAALLLAAGYFIAQGLGSLNAWLLCLVGAGFLAWFIRSPRGRSAQPARVAEAQGAGLASPQMIEEASEGKAPAVEPDWGARLRIPAALLLATLGQLVLDFRPAGYERSPAQGAILYGLALGMTLLALIKRDVPWLETPHVPTPEMHWRPSLVSVLLAWAGFGFGVASFAAMADHLFTARNLGLWAAAFICWFVALTPAASEGVLGAWSWVLDAGSRVRASARRLQAGVHLSGWTLLVLAAFASVAVIRLIRLDLVAPEMTSDHAEKLLDVMDILSGTFPIYFPRNTGREFLQFYMTALIARFGLGISFTSLKLGTTLAGLATLPFVYLLGRDLFDRRVGLLGLVLTGIGYWPNVISRIGLRFPLYPLFVAPAMYFLLRGLRGGRHRDFLWAGIALGLGLNGYSPARVLLFVMAMAVAVYSLHEASRGRRAWAWGGLGAAIILAAVIALPLMRYAFDNPDLFWGRTFTRLGQEELPYSQNPLLILLSNGLHSLLMFNWDGGDAWILGVPRRPALDVASAVFFAFGAFFLFARYVRRRQWEDLVVILAIPMLLLPSTLALAFPGENPALNRSSGAIPFVFLLPAFAITVILDSLRRQFDRRRFGWAAGAILALALAGSLAQNIQLTFVRYVEQYRHAAQNASEMGALVSDFAHSVGSYEEAYVVPYIYWADTRLVGMYAGDPTRDYAITAEALRTLDPANKPLLVIFHRDDVATQQLLESRFPTGRLDRYTSRIPDHDFLFYFVPGAPVP